MKKEIVKLKPGNYKQTHFIGIRSQHVNGYIQRSYLYVFLWSYTAHDIIINF